MNKSSVLAMLALLFISIATITSIAQEPAACDWRLYGYAGDTIWVGADNLPWDPNVPPVGDISPKVILKDSVDAEGNLYWWIKFYERTSRARQLVDGSIASFYSTDNWFTRLGICDTVGQHRWYNQARIVTYVGYANIFLMKQLISAKAYVTSQVTATDTVPESVEYYVDRMGLVLDVELHHGFESRRVVGAVLSGQRYGMIPTSVHEEDRPTNRFSVNAEQIVLSQNVALGSTIVIYDIQGREVMREIVNASQVVSIEHLGMGVYFAVLEEQTDKRPQRTSEMVVRYR